MSFLLDTDICSAYLKNEPRVVAQVMLHYGSLHVSVIGVGELLTWAWRKNAPASREQAVRDFLAGCTILDVDTVIGERFAMERARHFNHGTMVGELDLLHASTALVHQLTLVTHNTSDYHHIPNLTLADWLAP